MKFHELIKSNEWLSIELTFSKLYPDQVASIENYRLVYEALKFLQPVYSDIEIVLYQYYDDDGQPSVVDVSGINPTPEPDDITKGLALEFTTWDKWLGMDIKPLTLKEFTEIEIICHCLDEMTYAGFEQEEIQAEFDKLKSIVDEYKALTPEEKAKQTISLDELKKKISDKNLNSDE
jgi:hypothetical protein